ncbi:MAG: carboxypeptidase M32 [Pseudomonadales bacterium]|nr:carboxypeptidase M32 [Pseudomonadales bacterium]
MKAYLELEARKKRVSALNNAMGILQWDQQTMMPDGAAPARATVLAELSVLVHEMETGNELSDLIDEAGTQADQLDEWQRANLREIRHGFIHANAVPAELVEKMVLAQSESHMIWREARPANDFKRLAPTLDALFQLKREEADIKAGIMGVTPYEAMLDQFDPGRREVQVDRIFDDLEQFLPGFVQQVMQKQGAVPRPVDPQGPFPVAKQRELSHEVMKIFGFPFDHGRLDTAHHPFSGGAEGDVRITTRYDEADFMKSLMAVIHETGHALYENGLPHQWRGQPVGAARGMTLHESQSLLLEMQASRSEEFVRFLVPTIKRILGGTGPAWEADNILGLYRKVEPGLVRVFADEVTYPLHVILRYRLEKAILAGELATADLPGAWNDMMQQLVGVRPTDDTDGVMQDVHWPEGIFGYFPTYSLGAMASAQIFAAAQRDNSDILPGLGRGDIRPLFDWLDLNVRSQGCLYLPDELIEKATGSPLDTAAFKASIKARYLD